MSKQSAHFYPGKAELTPSLNMITAGALWDYVFPFFPFPVNGRREERIEIALDKAAYFAKADKSHSRLTKQEHAELFL